MAIDVFKTKGIDGIVEGDYTTWSLKWIERPISGIGAGDDLDVLIDEKNGVINIAFLNNSTKNQFGIYNISDFGVVFESPQSSDYTYEYPTTSAGKRGMHYDMVYLYGGGISRSLQTYLLLMRADYDVIEVWRGGSSALWSKSMAADFGRAVWPDGGAISLTGKYVLVAVMDKTTPYDVYLMLYEGS